METEIIDENHMIDWYRDEPIGILYERRGADQWVTLGGIPKSKILVDNWLLVERLKLKKDKDKIKK